MCVVVCVTDVCLMCVCMNDDMNIIKTLPLRCRYADKGLYADKE